MSATGQKKRRLRPPPWPLDVQDTQLVAGLGILFIAAALLSLRVLFVVLMLFGLYLAVSAILPKE